MCEAMVYLLKKNGNEELLLTDVDLFEFQVDGQVRLVSVYGEEKILKAAIQSMSLVNHRVLLIEQ